jgi:hypothetical protein
MNVRNKFKKIFKSRKKGDIMIITLFFILMSIAFLAFAYDVARIMYCKSYTRNLASAIALSTVNECGHIYQDDANGARVIIVHDRQTMPGKDYKGDYFADSTYANYVLSKNKSGMEKTYHIQNVMLNPKHNASGNVIPYSVDKDRFIVGSDGVNGEVEVYITAKIDLFFFTSLFHKQITIHESAIAQPKAYVTTTHKQIRDEQEIIFQYFDF